MVKNEETSGKFMAIVPCMLGGGVALDLGQMQSVPGLDVESEEGAGTHENGHQPELMEVGLLGWATWTVGKPE